jgi:hypothetical protein
LPVILLLPVVLLLPPVLRSVIPASTILSISARFFYHLF